LLCDDGATEAVYAVIVALYKWTLHFTFECLCC